MNESIQNLKALFGEVDALRANVTEAWKAHQDLLEIDIYEMPKDERDAHRQKVSEAHFAHVIASEKLEAARVEIGRIEMLHSMENRQAHTAHLSEWSRIVEQNRQDILAICERQERLMERIAVALEAKH